MLWCGAAALSPSAAIGVISFWATGYAFGFGGSNPFIGYRYFFLGGLPNELYIDFFLQYVFASTAVTIISGALAERTNIWAYVAFSYLVLGIVYPTSAHWVWGEGGWLHDLNYFVCSRHFSITVSSPSNY